MLDNYSAFPTKLFLDSNVILECRPLAELPWGETSTAGPILLLVTPKVLQEIDSKKSHGRLGAVAREFARLIAPFATSDDPVCVVKSPVEVHLCVAQCRRIDWTSCADLTREDADSRVVAEVLHADGIPFDERRLVAHDSNILITARRQGLNTFRVPESWLRPHEPHPKDQEVARLKRQIAELQSREPDFEIEIEAPKEATPVYLVEALTEQEQRRLITAILRAHPKSDQPSGMLALGGYDHTYNERYAKYEDLDLPKFAATFHKGLEVYFGQVPIAITVRNSGEVRADRAIIEVRVAGGWLNERAVIFVPSGPPAPVVETSLLSYRHLVPDVSQLVGKVGRHEFAMGTLKRSKELSAQCEDFRHGQDWQFQGLLWIDPEYTRETTIVVTVTAANLYGKRTETLSVSKSVKMTRAIQLVDLDAVKMLVQPNVHSRLQAALRENSFNGVESYFES